MSCQNCGTPLVRKVYPCGKKENMEHWRERKSCSNRCHRLRRLNESIAATEQRLRELRLRQNIAIRYNIAP